MFQVRLFKTTSQSVNLRRLASLNPNPKFKLLQCLQRRNFAIVPYISDSFVSLHSMTGIPWLVLIPTFTIFLRLMVTLPLNIRQRERIIKQQELRKVVKAVTPITKLRLAAVAQKQEVRRKSDPVEVAALSVNAGSTLQPEQITMLAVRETRKRQKKLFRKYNIQLWKNMILPVVQIPIWVCVSLGLRNLVKNSQPFLENTSETAKLFSNILDPAMDLGAPLLGYPMLIPLMLGTLSILNIEYMNKLIVIRRSSVGGIPVAPRLETSRVQMAMQSILNVSKLGCIFMIGVSVQAPILLSVYWVTSQLFSLVQNIILERFWKYEIF